MAIDPLGLVYEGRAGTGAAAITPDSPLTGALLGQIARKEETEKLKKGAAIKAFKPLGTPWDRDEADIATAREKLGKRSGELLMSNPKFIYQADSPEYQEFMGMYNELKEDIDFSKQHAAVYKDLMDKASSSAGLKHFDFDKTIDEYLAWSEQPLAERKKHPLPMPTLKEETFDPSALADKILGRFDPIGGTRVGVETSFGKADINYVGHTDEQLRSASIILGSNPQFKEMVEGKALNDDQRAIWEKGMNELGFESTAEYLAYVDYVEPLKKYKETGRSAYMPSAYAKNLETEDYIGEWLMPQFARIIQGDADMYSKKPNEHGYLEKQGTDFTDVPIGTFTNKRGQKESIFITGIYYDPDLRETWISTTLSDKKAISSGNSKDKYELLYSESQGMDNTMARLITHIAQAKKDVTEPQIHSYLKQTNRYKDIKKGSIDYQKIYPKEEIETYTQRKTKQDILNRRDDIIEGIRSQAKNIKYTEYGGFGGWIDESDKKTVDNINTMLKNLVISYKKEGGVSVKKYESPVLVWRGTIIGGSDLELKAKDGTVLAVIKSQEQLGDILQNATTKEEEKLVGAKGGVSGIKKPTFE